MNRRNIALIVLSYIFAAHAYCGSLPMSDELLSENSGAVAPTMNSFGQSAVISTPCLPGESDPQKVNALVQAKELAFILNEKTGQMFLIKNTEACRKELQKQL